MTIGCSPGKILQEKGSRGRKILSPHPVSPRIECKHLERIEGREGGKKILGIYPLSSKSRKTCPRF